MNSALLSIISDAYQLGSTEKLTVKNLGQGLIHQTFLIQSDIGACVLQGFNRQVFQFPERIDHNLGMLADSGLAEGLPFELPLPLKNKERNGLTFVDGKFYRLFHFVNGQTIQEISKPHQAYLAAKAYGQFAEKGKSIAVGQLQDTIPNFHRLDLRYDRLKVVAEQKTNFSEDEQELLDFYLGQSALITSYCQTIEALPQRLTHNDTKLNNLIFSENSEKVEALIDLDTVMGGYLFYDFGDLVRTVACSVAETSQDWEDLYLNSAVFESLLKGYLEGIRGFAKRSELETLLLGGEVMTCLMGMRFFTDHLEGNVYYKVEYPEQNFHRAKNQMILLRDQQEKREGLKKILNRLLQID